jgi:hypothetical protein
MEVAVAVIHTMSNTKLFQNVLNTILTLQIDWSLRHHQSFKCLFYILSLIFSIKPGKHTVFCMGKMRKNEGFRD